MRIWYRAVWSKPMMKLAEEFGISGRGLAKLCERLKVPVPPRGYWRKISLGQLIKKIPLPRWNSPSMSYGKIIILMILKDVRKQKEEERSAILQQSRYCEIKDKGHPGDCFQYITGRTS